MKTEANSIRLPAAIADARFGSAYNVLAEGISAGAFPGCAFGVVAKGAVVLQDALGGFTYDSAAPSVGPESIYDIASITKVAATTAVAMLLHQRGILDLDTPLGDLLPGFVVGRSPSEHARDVKLRHLLAHNSGLPGYVELFRTATTPDALLRACLQLPIEAEPGTRTEYSDIGFILLGKAVEVLTHAPLDILVRREIIHPLELNSTTFLPAAHAQSQIPPTEKDETVRHRLIQGEVQDENAWRLNGVAGHAGLFSNVPDLLRLAQEILRAFSGPNDLIATSLFTGDTIERFAERQGLEGNSRALGWDTPSPDSSSGVHFSRRSIGHLGFSGCSLWIDLEAEVAVVLLTNRTWPDRKSQSIREVRPAFHNAIREALLLH